MIKLSDLIPINLETEKEKFFASSFKYNPQFIYGKEISQKELNKHGRPKFWYLFLAKRILKKHLKEKDLFEQIEDEKKNLDQEKIKELVTQRLAFYQLENEYDIVFSKNFISRISVNINEKNIKISLPVTIAESEIEAILSHEIDTHIIRQLNYEQQKWFKKKQKYDFKPYLRTEEGLATVNELVCNKNKLAYKSAINYLAVSIALKNDFVATFNFLYKIWHDPERVWSWTVKKKRGMKDTSKKGAYTKDLVYFEGFIRVLNYLKKNNYDPSELYYGKLDLKDVDKAKKMSNGKKIVLPKIFVKDQSSYKQAIAQIIKSNLF